MIKKSTLKITEECYELLEQAIVILTVFRDNTLGDKNADVILGMALGNVKKTQALIVDIQKLNNT